MSLIPLWVKALVLAAIAAALVATYGAFVHAQRDIGREEVRAEWSADREKQKDAALKQAAANAEETQRRLTAQKDAQDAHDKDMARARADADAARSAAGRLSGQLAAFTAAARAAAGHSATGSERETAGTAIDLLGGMFSESDSRSGILAEALERSHAAGLQCQRSYDSLSHSSTTER